MAWRGLKGSLEADLTCWLTLPSVGLRGISDTKAGHLSLDMTGVSGLHCVHDCVCDESLWSQHV